MNEELKIIIRAITDEAKRNLQSITDELREVETASAESGKAVDKALGAMGKAALAAVGAITAVSTAMVSLGKKSLEFQKIQARLISSFQSVGLSAQQAGEVYKDLFGFLGEADTAVEAANNLAQLTQEQEALTEWTQILQGVYATFLNGLPVENLAEAANETANTGVMVGALADALNWAGVSEEAFQAKLDATNSVAERELLIRSTLNNVYARAGQLYAQNNRAIIQYNQSQVELDQALAEATKYVIPLMTSLNQLGAILLQVLKPAFETVSAVIIVFVQWIIAAVKAIGIFFGVFDSKGTEATDKVADSMNAIHTTTNQVASDASQVGQAFGDAAEQAKALKRQVMGFDELNVITPQASTSTGTGGAGAGAGGSAIPEISIPNLEEGLNLPALEDFEEKVEKVRKIMESLVPIVLAIAGGLALWKIADFAFDIKNAMTLVDKANKDGALFSTKILGEEAEAQLEGIKGKLKSIGGAALIAAGALLLVKGYSDAWINGLDWGNFALTLGGIGLIVGGIALAFGPFAAAIALAVGGVSAIVLGVKDFATNGYSLQSVLLILVGAVATLVGVLWAFNAALLANPITWIVVGVMALVAVFVILWNECEGFRNFWIELWEKIKAVFAKFVKSLEPLWNSIKGAFKSIAEFAKTAWGLISGKATEAWDKIKIVWEFVGPYFKMLWENIKVLFTLGAEFMGAKLKLAWEFIKVVWNQVVSYFKAIFDSISAIFDIFTAIMKGDWEGVSNAVKRLVGTWVDYFKNTWENIKKIFSAVGSYFSSVFGSAWTAIQKIFSNIGNFFTTIWNKIKTIFKNAGSTVGEAMSNAFKSAIEYILGRAVKIINGFISAINTALSVINAIPGVNIKTLNKLDVPKLATGGIVNGATVAMIGERGREAVLPLENNTGWMDALAERIAARNNSPSRIVLQVGEKELGYAVINSINGITRQTGKLQLVY